MPSLKDNETVQVHSMDWYKAREGHTRFLDYTKVVCMHVLIYFTSDLSEAPSVY